MHLNSIQILILESYGFLHVAESQSNAVHKTSSELIQIAVLIFTTQCVPLSYTQNFAVEKQVNFCVDAVL